jgi:activator of 2-hydroxyglutaryl-CoA dehydratase
MLYIEGELNLMIKRRKIISKHHKKAHQNFLVPKFFFRQFTPLINRNYNKIATVNIF